MKTMLIAGIVTLATIYSPKDKLTGRWQSKPSPKGNVTGILFKEDNSFKGYVNKKPFVTGTYLLQDSIFSFVDNGCNGMRGVYRMIFFHKGDSLRFVAIGDSCTERKAGMEKLVVGRVK